MRQVFESSESEAILMVDATNAFNSLNRQAALRNVLQLCPSLARVLINTYRADTELFIGGESIMSREGTTQGDPLAMVMYAISIVPMIKSLQLESLTQCWYADDASAGGTLEHLRQWWDRLVKIGPDFGYFPNGQKSWLVVKEGLLDKASSVFSETNVNVSGGRKFLGSAIGDRKFVEQYVKEKVSIWIDEVEVMCSMAKSQPHAVYSAFTKGSVNNWMYISRTTPGISHLLQPLEESIHQKLIPSLTGQSAPNGKERDLMALPARHGGLGLGNPSKSADMCYKLSRRVTAPIVDLIIDPKEDDGITKALAQQQEIKKEIRSEIRESVGKKSKDVYDRLPKATQRLVDFAREKGASSWLMALPIAEHGFTLHKGAFRDAICLRYGWRPPFLPANCPCGMAFTTEHALSCARGGFPSIRHNEIRDTTAHLLSQVCSGVGVEPHLQSLSGEQLKYQTANTDDNARLDITARGFWDCKQQGAYFDVRVFNPHAPSNSKQSIASCYRKHELEKKRAYEERVREVEHGCFTPLVFSATGGMGQAATVVYKRIASLLAEKQEQSYSAVMAWLRCRLSFSLLRSAIMCLRGSRSAVNRPAQPETTKAAIDLAMHEGKILY